MFRLPVTLWLMILGSLFGRIVLTSGVLVAVIAFTAAIKPLADGKLDAGDALKFIVLAIPPMLAYALPFAGGFCTTLVYHRLQADNEWTAARAGGISYRALLAPALVAGLVLSGALVLLNEQVIPRFLRGMQELVTTDAARFMTSSISKGRAVEFGGFSIYADRAERLEPPPDSGASDQLVLLKMAAVRTDASGTIVGDVTASRAVVWLFPGERLAAQTPEERAAAASKNARTSALTYLYFQLENADGNWPGAPVARADDIAFVHAVPGAFEDDPKFLTHTELRALKDQPEQMNWIEAARRDLAFRLAEPLMLNRLATSLRSQGRAELQEGKGRRLVIEAGGLAPEGERFVLVPTKPGAPVVVHVLAEGSAPARWSAQHAWLSTDFGPDQVARRLGLRLELENFRSSPGDADAGSEIAHRVRSGLSLQPDPASEILRLSSTELVTRAQDASASASVRDSASRLEREIQDLRREITSKQHERAALALSCFVMVVTGAVAAIRLAGRLPLTVYLWSFFPALGSLITISSGQQIVHESGTPGLLLLWGGVGALAVYTLAMYSRVARR